MSGAGMPGGAGASTLSGSTANGLNQLTAVGAKALTHDARGNVTAFGSDLFGYSSENLLTAGPGGAALGYDPLLRLYQTVAGGTTARFVYDGLAAIAENNASNAPRRRFVFGPGDDEPIVWYEGGGTTNRRFLGADERGSIVSVTDSAGAVLSINRYDEYGQPQASNLGRFGYTGQMWLPEIGQWYYKARIYAPVLGRFLQTDPIGYGGGANLYAYVLADPANLIDTNGMKDCGLESNWRNGDCADSVVYYQLRQANPAASAGDVAYVGGIVLDLFHERITYDTFLASLSDRLPGEAYRVGGTTFWMNIGSEHYAEPSFIASFRGSALEAATEGLMEMLGYGWETAQSHRILPDLEGYSIGDGLPNGPFYERYWILGGTMSAPRLITPGGSLFYLSPYHYKKGPGVPTGFIELHAVFGTPH
ncbi:MAG: RHS repeat-associated core domain-containing protein [Sphingomicrobium sp.]